MDGTGTFQAGRFTLAYVGFQEDMDEPTLNYVTSWDTWEEAQVAFNDKGSLPPGYQLIDNETDKVWTAL